MSVSKRLRYEVLRRDNHACRYCGAAAPDVALTVDHVTPTALGGTDTPDNLVAACIDCNAGKSASHPGAPLLDSVSNDAIRWALAKTQAEEILKQDAADWRQVTDWFEEVWDNNVFKWDNGDWLQPLPLDWDQSLKNIMSHGLGRAFIADAVRIAINSQHVQCHNTFRYFCGICWKEIDRLHDIASAINTGGQLI